MIIEGLLDYLDKREEMLRKELETAIAINSDPYSEVAKLREIEYVKKVWQNPNGYCMDIGGVLRKRQTKKAIKKRRCE